MNTPKQIAENYIDTGAAKAEQPKGRMFLLAVLAGMFIALAGVAASIGTALAGKLAGACIFPTGLAMVIVAGSELFTGNSLMVIPLLEKRITAGKMLAAWAVVYLGNMAGGVLTAALAVVSGALDGCAEAVVSTAVTKCSLSFGAAFARGVLCNILVCTAVWMTMAAKDVTGKIAGLYLPVMAFVLCGFEHSIANMFYVPAGLFTLLRLGEAGAVSWGGFFLKNLLPVTLGNIVGGAGLGVVLHTIYLPSRRSA